MKDSIRVLLQSWDRSVSASFKNTQSHNQSRRDFIKKILLTSSALSFSNVVLANVTNLNDDKWQTISAVQMHMFPKSVNSPDADSVNATAFLKSILEWPGVDEGDKKFILDGVGWLNGLSEKVFNKQFNYLNDKDKEQVLRTVEKSQAGENWLSMILLYLFEALLTDPVYGGNTDGQGWKWLEHQPGFPRPVKNKRYFNL